MIGLLVEGLVFLPYLPNSVTLHFANNDYGPKGALVGIIVGFGIGTGVLITFASFAMMMSIENPACCPLIRVLILPHRAFWLSNDEHKKILSKALLHFYQSCESLVLIFFLVFGAVSYSRNMNTPPSPIQWWFWLIAAVLWAALISCFVGMLLWLNWTRHRLSHENEPENSIANSRV